MTPRAIVIGTGASGLTATVTLAQYGFEVLALERGKQLGGFLNPFARKHFLFDPGVHYVGGCDRGGMAHAILGKVGVDAESLFAKMDPDGYDLLRFPDFELRIPAGRGAYRDRLAEAFPEDVADIDRVFAALDIVAGLLARKPKGLTAKIRRVPPLINAYRWSTESYEQFLRSTVRNPKLRAVFGAQWGNLGVAPSRLPAIYGLGVIVHYLEGGYFPRGGSGSLRDAMVASARELGATFRRRAEVVRIRLHKGRVVGVTLEGGEEIDAEIVVSTIDPTLTYGRLIESEALPPKLREHSEKTRPSLGALCLFFGMRRDLRDHGLGAFNVWDYPTWDVERQFHQVLAGAMPDRWAFFLSPNSLKDDTNAMAPEGCSTLEVITLAPFEPFAQWERLPAFKRGAPYEELKRRWADSLLDALAERWPGLIGDVVVEEIASPVTNSHYVNAVAGGIYGPMVTLEQVTRKAFRTESPIAGLFLGGAGVAGPGVAPCLWSGILAARAAARSVGATSTIAPPIAPSRG